MTTYSKFFVNIFNFKVIVIMSKETVKTILTIVKYVITAILGALGGSALSSCI